MRRRHRTREHGLGYHVHVAVMLAGLVACQAIPARAQDPGADLTGQRVRVVTGPGAKPRVGVLTGVTPDTLTIRTGPATEPLTIRRADVVDLRVSRGVRRHTLLGLLAGAAAWGAAVGLMATFDTLDESGVGEPVFWGGLLAAGAGIGTLVKHDRWERIPDTALAPRAAPAAGMVGVRFAWRF